MAQVGIFFGSDTGNTEGIATTIQQQLLKEHQVTVGDVEDIAYSTPENLAQYGILILGVPTWYYGELQCDWDEFLPLLKKMDLKNKQVAIFGCGDQEDYADYFCDAMGTLADIVQQQGATLVGRWPIQGYTFEASKALSDPDHFVGLAIDEDRQPELTKARVHAWVEQLIHELKLATTP